MKYYKVKSYHDVYVDDYNNGEGENVNSYVLNGEVQADSLKEAVNAYLNDNLGYNLGFENCEVCPEDKNLVQTSCLVDADNLEPSNTMFEAWRAGTVKLYSNHIDMFIYEVNEVDFN